MQARKLGRMTGMEPAHREVVIVPDPDLVEEEQGEGERREEEEGLSRLRLHQEHHRAGDREGDADGVEVPAHPQQRLGVVGRGARSVPHRTDEIGEGGESEERDGRREAEPLPLDEARHRGRQPAADPIDEDEPDDRHRRDEAEVVPEDLPVVPSEHARDVVPRDEAIVERRVDGEHREAAHERQLRRRRSSDAAAGSRGTGRGGRGTARSPSARAAWNRAPRPRARRRRRSASRP